MAPAVRAEGAGWRSEAELTGIMIGTPAYGGLVASRYLTSSIGTSQLLHETLRAPDGRVLPIAWCVIDGESLIHRARNNVVAKFMTARPELSHLVFVDGDLEWEPRDLLRLIGHDLPVVCGVYPKKTEPAEFPFHPLLDDDGHSRRNPVTGAVQIANGPTGFMCIKREVFVAMREAYPALRFASDKASPEELDWLYAYFDTFVEEGILWSEDYGFCRRWRALGGEVWCDPAIRLGHVGQRIYQGAVADLWEVPGPVPEGAERVLGWVVPKGDPWFVPALRASGGQPDREVIQAALAHVTEFGLAIDVGAHIGTWARPLAARFEQVIAVEPNPGIVPLLRANVEGLPNVDVRNVAAWDRARRLRLRKIGVNSGEYAVVPGEDAWDETGSGHVDSICLDDLHLARVGLIKLDVEGAEVRALCGAMQVLIEQRPVVVVEEDREREASRWLLGLGMREAARYPIAPGHPKDNVVMVWPQATALAAE